MRAKPARHTEVRTAARPRLSMREHGPQRVFTTLWHDRILIYQLVKRELVSRYRGSVLGLTWSFVTPLLMLSVYTFVFSVIFKVRWDVDISSRGEFAMVLFAGLIVFQFFSECVSRAPTLMFENVSYIKRIVFPLESLAWVVVGSAMFNMIVSSGVLVFVHLVLVGWPPLSVLWLPIVLFPLAIFTVGCVWILSSIGVFLRDTRQVVGVIVPILLFATPIFYPVSKLPEELQRAIYLNPLAYIVEQVRDVMLFGRSPEAFGLSLYLVLACGTAWLALAWFTVTKRGFADVV
jgi:lipopolysaccharide transport system permease protein